MQDWEDGSTVNSGYCSGRRPKFASQHPHWYVSQLLLTLARFWSPPAMDNIHISSYFHHWWCFSVSVHADMWTYTHTYGYGHLKIKQNKTTIYNSNSREFEALFRPPRHQAHTWCTHIRASKTLIYKIKCSRRFEAFVLFYDKVSPCRLAWNSETTCPALVCHYIHGSALFKAWVILYFKCSKYRILTVRRQVFNEVRAVIVVIVKYCIGLWVYYLKGSHSLGSFLLKCRGGRQH